uniref:Uncharacterized protein n=1 Tax=Strigamia maritima TaxID=126957 RepID=T1IGU9_STRMM
MVLVERAIQSVVNGLRKKTTDGTKWGAVLDQVVWGLNTNRHSSSKFAPFELLHAYLPANANDLCEIPEENEGDLRLELLERRALAKDNLTTAQNAQKKTIRRKSADNDI